jgi:hypothetical protein
MKMHSTIRTVVLAAAWTAAASALHAADALAPVALPSDFGVHAIGSVEAVVYVELSGELFNVVDRKGIEAVCTAARHSDQTTKTPRFEPGYDKPNKTETKLFANPHHWASYIIDHVYVCDRPEGRPGNSGDALCDCTYRVIPHYHAQIKNKTSDGLEIIDLDVAKRTARRQVLHGYAGEDIGRGQFDLRAFAPEVVGKDVVAGIPCVVRRRSMGGANYADYCITEDPERHLPEQIRLRSLSTYIPRLDGKGPHMRSRADKVVPNGAVDAAVFAIPERFTVKDRK